MDKDPSSGEPEKRHIGGDLVIPVAALAFTLYYFSTIINSPWTAQVSAFFIGTVLILLIAVFLLDRARLVLRREADLGLQRLSEPVALVPRRLGLFALTLGFIVFIQWGGFTITAFVFLAAAMLLLSRGRNWKLILALAAVLSVGGYFLFIHTFEVRFPKGPFELMMAQVL